MARVLKVKENDRAAAFGPPSDFSGEFHIYFMSGALAYRAEFQDGKRDGQQCSYWEDGKLSVVGYARNGKAVGTWLHFEQGGTLMFEERFSEIEGTYSKRWFDVLGRTKRIEYYREGVEVDSVESDREV